MGACSVFSALIHILDDGVYVVGAYRISLGVCFLRSFLSLYILLCVYTILQF